MPSVAEVILRYSATLGPQVMRTTMMALEVPGTFRAKQVVHGKLDVTQALDFTTTTTLSDSMVRRYGQGFGAPIKQDLSVLPAISMLPDASHALWALGYEEATHIPGPGATAATGLTTTLHGQDFADLEACIDFQDLVLQCLDLGLPVGTPRALWPQLLPQAPQAPPAVPPPTTTPVQPPATIPPAGLRPLSPASVRAEEFRSMAVAGAFWLTPTAPTEKWLMVITGAIAWPFAKPFAVEALRLYRLARKRLGDTREIPQEDR